MNARSLGAVLSLYAPDSMLLLTFSPHIIRTDDHRREYFTRLAERPGLAVSLHEKCLHLILKPPIFNVFW